MATPSTAASSPGPGLCPSPPKLLNVLEYGFPEQLCRHLRLCLIHPHQAPPRKQQIPRTADAVKPWMPQGFQGVEATYWVEH